MARLSLAAKIAVLVLFIALIALLQAAYDRAPVSAAAVTANGEHGVSAEAVRMMDFGFHPAVASFLWATTMPEILDLFRGKTEYFPDLAYVNAIDPKLTYPYAFSELTLPAVPTSTDPDAIAQADAIGIEGLKNADPDWRIPYYLATNEFLYAKDEQAALKYYNIAANTPGIPQYAERFALNFGIETNQRQKTEDLWTTIRDSTNDPDEKTRAQAYINHLQDFDYLDQAAAIYKQKFGIYPTSTTELVAKGIIPSVPVDPFGFTFILDANGKSAIDQGKLPSYMLSEPAQ